MNKLFLSSLCLLTVFIFSSCENDENEVIPDAICDVYIKVIKDGDQNKYSIFARAYSNFIIDNANVTTPNNKVFDLAKQDLSPYYFTYYTDKLSEVAPVEGNYTFNVNSNKGIKIKRINKMTNEVAEIPIINSCVLAEDELSIKWEESETTDFYIIRLLDKDNKIIFSNEYLKNNKTVSETITDNSKGWLINKKLTDVVSITFMAAIFENKLNPSLFYIQSIAETKTSIEE
jgi:hypothetical protein